MSEHKNCPHCGKVEALEIASDHEMLLEMGIEPDSENAFAINCNINRDGCGATGGFRKTIEEAWEAWDRRDNAAVKELVSLLKEAHECVCDLLCPSTGKAGVPIKHGELCSRIREAIKKAEGLWAI
jgi:hypothetical protein